MLPLIVKKSDNPYERVYFHWRSSKPFVENRMAVLIHRPRKITTHKLKDRKPHDAIQFHCGSTQVGKRSKFTFLDDPPEGKIVCARCEELAVERGLPSSSELAGRHVCTGGVKAVKSCCNTDNTKI